MKDLNTLNFAKTIFALFFIAGSFFLLGALITKRDEFAAAGYMLLILGVPINLLFVLGLVIYGIIYRSKLKTALIAVCILTINIPVAIIYTVIGLNIFK